MPTYEYLCPSCDTRFEAKRSMADADTPYECPDGHTARRVFSVFQSVSVGGGGSSPNAGAAPSMPMTGGHSGCACH